MGKNTGTADRVIRLVIAALAAYFATSATGAMVVVLWAVAAIMVLTAAVGFCPIWKIFGISTRK